MLVTARDIIFLWVARMVMLALEFTGTVPFRDVYVHSVIQAADGRRMSKSLGTGIDPLEEIDRHGADAVRFGLLAMSSTQDVRFSAEKIAQGQALANKLFNAARLILLRVDADVEPAARPLLVEDRWILSRLGRASSDLSQRFADYEFSHAALGLYDFVYAELCDWYLELVKGRLGDESEPLSATLLYVLRSTLALAHPVIPFVTEELWSYARRDGEGLLASMPLPQGTDALLDPKAEATVGWAIDATRAVRAWRDESGVGPGVQLAARLSDLGADADAELLARMARLELSDTSAAGEPVARVPLPGGGAIELLEGAGIDPQAHNERLERRRLELERELDRARSKLQNDGFVARAPAAVVEREREKAQRLEAELSEL